jgi:putative membrane protein
MPGFLVRLLVSAFGLWIASTVVRPMHFDGVGSLIAAALLLGVVNAVVRPILVFLTLPITILSLGLFLLVINAATLGLVAGLLKGFELGGFGPAVLASLVVSVTSWFASWFVGPRGRVQIIYTRHDL